MPLDGGRLVVLGVVTGPHGIAGEVKVKSFTGNPADIWNYGPLRLGDSQRELKMLRQRPLKGGFIVSFEGIADRNAAEAIKGVELKIARSRLPEPAAGEYYHEDLAGLAVLDVNRHRIGTVERVENYGAGDLLEVRMTGRKDTVLLPFDKRSVPEVNLDQGHVIVDPLPGLYEEQD